VILGDGPVHREIVRLLEVTHFRSSARPAYAQGFGGFTPQSAEAIAKAESGTQFFG